jgi:hypothetical protein
MSTYTTSLGLEEITPGDQAGLWGNTTNTNLSLIDQAIAGVTPINLGSASGSTYVLTYYNGAADESRSAVIKVTGTATGSNTIQIPSVQKLYVFRNDSGAPIIVQTLAAANSVTLANGEATLVFCDGFNAYAGIATAGAGTITVPYGGTGATTFGAGGFVFSLGGTSNLTAIPNIPLGASAGAVSGTLPVANGGTGSTSFSSGGLLQGNGTGAVGSFVGGANGQVATWNGSQWVAAAPSSGVSSVSGSGNISVSPTTGSPVVSISSSPSFTSVSASSGMTIGGASVLTTSTGAQLSGTNNFIGTNNYSTAATIVMNGSTVGDQRLAVNGAGLSTGISPGSIQLGTSGAGMYWDPNIGPSLNIITPSFGANAKFATSGYNYQGNNNASWQTTSDANIKTNIHPITNVLEKINALNPTHFEYKDKVGKTRTGFIAQEFETVFPGHVTTDAAPEQYLQYLPEGTTTIKTLTMDLIPYLVKAVQELSAKVDAQAAEIAALQAKVNS